VGREGNAQTQVEDHFVGTERLTGSSIVYLQVPVIGVDHFVTVLQIDILEEGEADIGFKPCIQSPELEMGIVVFAENGVLYVRYHPTHPSLPKERGVEVLIVQVVEFDFVYQVKQEKVGSVVQLIDQDAVIEHVLVNGLPIHGAHNVQSLHLSHLIFGMVEGQFNTPIVFKPIPDTVIVLGYGEGFAENALVPSYLVFRKYTLEYIIITQRGLLNVDITMGVPFLVITPGKPPGTFPSNIIVFRSGEGSRGTGC
jgi:hypothetical protein